MGNSSNLGSPMIASNDVGKVTSVRVPSPNIESSMVLHVN